MGSVEHWEAIYQAKAEDELSWTEEDPAVSLRLITTYGDPALPVVDVGAGRSQLADRLVEKGFGDVTVLDCSEAALAAVRARVGHEEAVSFVVADVTEWVPHRHYGVWHDRAVLHFLSDPDSLARYVERVTGALGSGSIAVIGCFASDGPETCSGLPVVRRDATALAEVFGQDFELLHSERTVHTTPWGAVQPFTWVVLRRR